MRIPEGEERKAQKKYLTYNDRISAKLMSNTKLQIQEVQRTQSKINAQTNKKTTSQHIIFKLQKIKDKEKLTHWCTLV